MPCCDVPADRGDRSAIAGYMQGWAEADPDRIRAVTPCSYVLDDPVLGIFGRENIEDYFALIADLFEGTGRVDRRDVIFCLHGPVWPTTATPHLLFWREAPRLGLSGISRIDLECGRVCREHVTYDLSLAVDVLRRRSGEAHVRI